MDDGRARVLGTGAALLAGVGVAAQSRINGELGARLDDGIAAAMISFGVGLVLLLLMVPWMGAGLRRVAAALRGGRLRWWQCVGGACGAFLVATQGLTVATLGVAVFTVAVVAGQSGSSLAVDRAGLAPGGRRPVTRRRAFGAALCVVAVGVAVSDRFDPDHAPVLALLPLAAGVGIAWQQGMNGFVRQAADGALPATLINFAVGSTVLLAALIVTVAVRGAPAGSLPPEPWLYLGGPIGMMFIALAAAVVKRIGVLLLGLGTIAGQIIGALAVDATFPSAAGPPGTAEIAGCLLALGAVAIAVSPGRRRATLAAAGR